MTITPSSTSSSALGGSGTVNSASVGQASPAPASANSSTNSINHHSSASSSTGVPLSGSSLAGLNTNICGTFSDRSSKINKNMKIVLYSMFFKRILHLSNSRLTFSKTLGFKRILKHMIFFEFQVFYQNLSLQFGYFHIKIGVKLRGSFDLTALATLYY